jgi:non-specific serine/threonine protein kinase
LLAPGEILTRLRERFQLLKRPDGRGSIARQRTLLATVEWSYALLEHREQQLFRRLSVFAGAFDLAGANAMGGVDTLDVVGRLVDKSLVIARSTDQATRYHLLDTLRDYAWERLEETGEVELARKRHLDHFLGRAESMYVATETIDGPTRVLDDDLDNLRAAMEWCEQSDPSAGLRLIGSTRTVWYRRDSSGGRRWAHLFLERCPEPSLARVHALIAAGELEILGDNQRSRQLLTEARHLAAHLGDQAARLMADTLIGAIAFLEGHTADAVNHLERCRDASEELGDQRALARVLLLLSLPLLTDRSRREEARANVELAQRIGVEVCDRYITGVADYTLGMYWRWTGRPQHALEHLRRAALALNAVGEVTHLSAALLLIARLQASRDPVRAARLGAAAMAVSSHLGVRHTERVRQATDQLRTELAARLGKQADEAWAQGQRLSVDEAVTLALQDLRVSVKRSNGLTSREIEVAESVARGRTSSEIGALLHLSTRTVDNHLAHIFNKLGLSTRFQVANWFVTTQGSLTLTAMSSPDMSNGLSSDTDVRRSV